MFYYLFIMDMRSLSDSDIEAELGRRIRELRLRKNITQEELANAACLHRNAIGALESGKGSRLATLIAVLRELDALDQLDQFIPEITISPLQLARSQGKQRQRATSAPSSDKGGESEW